MGCQQTTIKPPSPASGNTPVVRTLPKINSADPPTSPIYVKSALKKSRANGRGKTEKLSFLKRKPPPLNKSVNFDETVRVKLRTPTPKETRYRHTTSAKPSTKQTSNNNNNHHNQNVDDDDDDTDDQVSSISSQEDISNEQTKPSSTAPPPQTNPPVQRNHPNGFWYKNNSVAVLPMINNTKEKPPQQQQQLSNHLMTSSAENLNLPVGNRFRVRRKIPHSVSPTNSNSVDSNERSSTSTYRTLAQLAQPSPSTQRLLPNISNGFIEHPTAFSDDRSSPQTNYITVTRRPIERTLITEK